MLAVILQEEVQVSFGCPNARRCLKIQGNRLYCKDLPGNGRGLIESGEAVLGSCPGYSNSQRWRCRVPCPSMSINAVNVMKHLRSSYDRRMRSQGSVAPDAIPKTSSELCPSLARTPQDPRPHVVRAVQPEVSVRRWSTSNSNPFFS